jgi:CRP-like cAMP-binding protein
MVDEPRRLLKQTALFRDASGEAFERVVAQTIMMNFAPGERVLEEGQHAAQLYVLVSGTCGVFYSGPDGQGVLVKIFGSPSVFGEMELLSGLPRMEYVEAFEPSRVLVCSGAAVLELWREQPGPTFVMLGDLARRLCVAAYHERALAFHDVEERLAGLCLSFMDAFARPGPDGWIVIRFALTHPMLARCLGVTTRSIDRALKAWGEEGLVEHRKGFLAFKSREALIERVGEDRLGLYTRLFSDEQ